MEKQKVFWVVLSVSVFVVVVLVAGVLLLRQQPGTAPHATVTPMNGTGTNGGTGGQLYEYQREAPQNPPALGPQAGTPPGTPSGSDQQTMHFYIGEGAKPGTSTVPGSTSPGVTAPSPGPVTAAPAPAVPAPTVATPSPVQPTASVPSASSAPSRQSSTVAAKPRTAKPSLQARTPKKGTDYWIQAGSYKSQTKAEELVTLLQGKGLGSRMFSWASKGETYYRVRVGPYSNKGEADKFLALVQQVQGLEASYVSMVPSARTSVN